MHEEITVSKIKFSDSLSYMLEMIQLQAGTHSTKDTLGYCIRLAFEKEFGLVQARKLLKKYNETK